LLSLDAYYLIVVGIREMHRTTTGMAVGVILLFLGIAFLVSISISVIVLV
jgi:hypothetical protein